MSGGPLLLLAGERPAEVAPASEWCQRWRPGGSHTWTRRRDGGFDPARYSVERLSEADAKRFVVARHYSGSYPAARLRYGLYEQVDGVAELVGVAVLSVPVQRAVLSGAFPTLEPYAETLELGRFILADGVPANGESWFLARAFELAAADGLRGVVSFADPVARTTADGSLTFPGHLGLIYQASNAVYCGRGTGRRLRLLPDASVLNDRALAKVRGGEVGHEYVERKLIALGARPPRPGEHMARWLAGALSAAGVRELTHPGNHRYCFRLGSRAERRRTPLGLAGGPYPKALDVAA